jgi:NADH dehydrogenase/NADH:ubiquinone oxidoreductase subunit G
MFNYVKKLQVISDSVSFFSSYELGLQNDSPKKSVLQYYINSTIDNSISLLDKTHFIFYQGHHGDITSSKSNLLLPATTHLEKAASYVNYLFTIQKTKKILSKQPNVRADWEILNMFSEVLKLPLKILHYNNLIKKIRTISPLLPFSINNTIYTSNLSLFLINNFIFSSVTTAYYNNDIISRASKIMALCDKKFKVKAPNFF